MTDNNLREIASRCEAKLHGLRRTAEGAVISFVIHPNEIPRALMLDALGTRYMLAFVAIGDDEEPIPASPHDAGERPLSVTRPAQQGVIHPGLTPKARYAAMTAGEQAVTRAALLPKDERFRAWATEQVCPGREFIFDERTATEYIRGRCCDRNSRKRIATEPEYMDRFQQMLTEFMIAVGELPEPR